MANKYLNLDQLEDGDCLYHYTKGTSLMNILKTQAIFATRSSFLNDSNEMGYILHVIDDVIREIKKPAWQELLRTQIVNSTDNFKRHDSFVLSFSTDGDSITLWAEFGDRTGYSIAFDGIRLLDQIEENQHIYCHGYVIYSEERQRFLIRNLLMEIIPKKINASFEDIMEDACSGKDKEQFEELCRRMKKILSVYAMFFKQEEFAPEREYRLVFRDPDKSAIRFREKDGFLLPYIEIGFGGMMPVTKVTVAPKNHVDLAKKGMIQYLEQLGYDVPVQLSRLKLRY